MKIRPVWREGIALRDGQAVFRHFRISADHVVIEPEFDADALGEPGHLIEMEIEVDGRLIPRCKSVTVSGYDDGPEVTGEALRRLPIRRLVKDATARAAAHWRLLSKEGKNFALVPATPPEQAETYRQFTEDARRPRRGSAITDDHLRRVAEVYRAALENGDPPTKTIAEQFHATESTAGRWVKRARQRDYLGPAAPGRASA